MKKSKIATPPSKKKIDNSKIEPSFLYLFIYKKRKIILALITLTGLLIRLYRLGFLSLWIDEYIHATAAKNFAEKNIFSVSDYNGILLTYINCLLAKIMGLSEFVLRLPSAFFGSLLIPLVYFFTKKLFNFQTALIAAILICFSPYLIFWSRVDRMYETFTFFYIATLFVFWILFEENKKTHDHKIVHLLHSKKIYLPIVFFFLILMAALLQFQFIFLFISIGFYATFVVIYNAIIKKRIAFSFSKYSILSILTILFFILLFTPITDIVNKPLLAHVSAADLNRYKIPGWILNMLTPNWNTFRDFIFSENYNKYLKTYDNLLGNDFSKLYYLGLVGFIFSFAYKYKSALFLIASFIIPFLFLSFLLTEPNVPRYLCFVYPFFIIAVAVSLYFLISKGKKILLKNRPSSNLSIYVIALVLLLTIPFNEVFSLINSNTYGHQLKEQISEAAFVNWREPCLYVKKYFKKGDLILSTVSNAPNYYIEDGTLFFRQLYFNLDQKKLMYNPIRPFQNGANSYDEFVETVKRNNRGWLLVDHYINSAYTDPRIIDFIHNNLTYHFEASQDGSVQVFSWDHNNKVDNEKYFLELGKTFSLDAKIYEDADPNDLNQYSMSFNFNLKACDSVEIAISSFGIDANNEAAIRINGKNTILIPKPTDRILGTSVIMLDCNKNFLKAGLNDMMFIHYSALDNYEDNTKGYLIKKVNIISHYKRN